MTHSAQAALEARRDEDRKVMTDRLEELEDQWPAFWRSLTGMALGIVAAGAVGGVAVGSAIGDIEKNGKTANAALEAAEHNAEQLDDIEEVLDDHAAHLDDLLTGQAAIAEAVGATLPKRKIKVKGAPD